MKKILVNFFDVLKKVFFYILCVNFIMWFIDICIKIKDYYVGC